VEDLIEGAAVKDLVEGGVEDLVEGAVEDLIEGAAVRGEGTGSVF